VAFLLKPDVPDQRAGSGLKPAEQRRMRALPMLGSETTADYGMGLSAHFFLFVQKAEA
jgi:hypothetical protein